MNTKTHENSSVESGLQKCSKLFGVYPQKQDGVFMQRIKILGGRLNWNQWRKISCLTEKYSQGYPLHLTTRQDIELHNLSIENIPDIQKALAEVGLTTFGAGGDSVRNITVCSACDLCKDAIDLLPLAQYVQQYLEQQPVILNLPRKFKISFSGCEKACAKPWLSDLGFIAKQNGLFDIIGAGSLGVKPKLGILLCENLPPAEIPSSCVAAINLFNKYGDYTNRHRARFRHIRVKLGDNKFKEELHSYFNRTKKTQCQPQFQLRSTSNKKIRQLYRLQLPNGDINPQKAIELADSAERVGAILRINLEHGIEIYGEQDFQLPESLAGFTSNPIIVACPGSTTCPRALVNCHAIADKIRKELPELSLSNLRINISGCPNNCAQSAIADIGLIGTLRKEKGQQKRCFRLFIDGGNGRKNKLSEPLNVVRDKDVIETVKKLLNR
ncbi:MAG: nitrite/sulfite reductase [Sedimentisphaerales bacterium]|nr:nitrite/sulfite reductase [Sedimentisphaerales bacterium]